MADKAKNVALEEALQNSSDVGMDTELSLLCRICGLPNEYLIPIFEGEGQENELADKIHSYLPIKVNQTDNYPDNVCYQCASTLLAFHDLFKCCVEANVTLCAKVVKGGDSTNKKCTSKPTDDASKDSQERSDAKYQVDDQNGKHVILEKNLPENLQIDDQGHNNPQMKFPTSYNTQSSTETDLITLSEDNELTILSKNLKQIKTENDITFDDNDHSNGSSSSQVDNMMLSKTLSQETNSSCRLDTHEKNVPENLQIDDQGHNNLQVKFPTSYNTQSSTETDPITLSEDNELTILPKNLKQIKTENDIIFDDNDHSNGSSSSQVDNMMLSKTLSQETSSTCHLDTNIQNQRAETNLDSFSCAMCDKSFNKKFNLQKHLTSHVKDFPCPVCSNSYISQFILDCHLSEHTATDIANYQNILVNCYVDNCTQYFKSKFQLFFHHKTHHNMHKDTLSVTKKQVKHECGVCKKQYSTKFSLKQHSKIHTGASVHTCQVCGATYKWKSSLTTHINLHSQRKKYKCHICRKTFLRSNLLKEHLRIHNGEKKFACPHCKYCSIQATVLKNHITNKHVMCVHCKQIIGNKTQTIVHIWKHHFDKFDSTSF